jgi:hypothetical protein
MLYNKIKKTNPEFKTNQSKKKIIIKEGNNKH